MLLSRLKMRNFGPYYEEHGLAFSVDESGPVTLVHGENLRGKTSLLNAIRWCLYGAAKAKSQEDIPTYELISYDAIGEGDFTMRVTLEFMHDGDEYVLERHVQAESRPESDESLKERLHLERNGQFVPRGEIEGVIRGILHPNVSRFFLFDAELLDDYEVLVGDGQYDREMIRDSIERILGLPALTSARESLSELEQSAAKEQNKQVKAEKDNKRLVATEEQLESEVDSLEDDFKGLVQLGMELTDKIRDLRRRQKEFASAKSDVERIEELEGLIEERTDTRDDLLEKCRRHLKEGWWQPVAWMAQQRLSELQKDLEEESERRARMAQLGEERNRIEQALKGDTRECPLCSREITKEAQQMLEIRLQDVVDELDLEDDTSSPAGWSVSEAERLREFQSTSHLARVVSLEEQIRRLNLEISGWEREIRSIRDRLKNIEEEDVRNLEKQLEQCIEDRGKAKDEADDVRERLDEKRDELNKTRRAIANLPEANPKIRARRELYSVLESTFDRAVDKFAQRVRMDVESQASSIFKRLIREPDYAGLEINEHYGLNIIDDQGRTIKRRSAGGAQVVALSLVCALNRSAVREGPLVIDTPLARLDPQHRENVLTHLPKLVPQIVFLVQSGELRREDREYLVTSLGCEYELVRDGSPTKTRIEQHRSEGE